MINYYNVFYFLTVSDGVKEVFDTFSNFFTFFTVVSLIAFAIAVGATIEYGSNKQGTDYKSALVWRKFLGRIYWMCQIICIITWLGYVLTPTKKDCMLIVAGGAVGNFITTDTSSRAIPADISKFLHLSLNKEIDDLQKEVQTDIRKELGIETQKDKLIQQVEKLTKEQLIEYLKNDTTILNK